MLNHGRYPTTDVRVRTLGSIRYSLASCYSRIARLRFTNRVPVCDTVVLPVEEFSANGEQCLNWLSQRRGQAQSIPILHCRACSPARSFRPSWSATTATRATMSDPVDTAGHPEQVPNLTVELETSSHPRSGRAKQAKRSALRTVSAAAMIDSRPDDAPTGT